MRVTSVYLMAEETGNEATRKLYKDTLLKYTAACIALAWVSGTRRIIMGTR